MNNQIDVLLNIKLYALRRQHLDDLTFDELKEVLYQTKWFVSVPTRLSVISSDINSLTFNDIVNYYADKKGILDEELQQELQQEEIW